MEDHGRMNHPSNSSHCHSLAEGILISVAAFGCYVAHTENLPLSLAAALHPVPRGFFSAVQIVKLCVTISFCYQISEV